MVPMYVARVEHLTHHETVTALCGACGLVAEVQVAELLRRIPSYKRIATITLAVGGTRLLKERLPASLVGGYAIYVTADAPL